ncbi:hypothetical protein QCA50_014465 [Cerrena zonata]|uniref:Uncharacterized protein n=1 Tax=Cerrena zonata TaxID=2478898 RepID=A0AAW0FSI6_9APHY
MVGFFFFSVPIPRERPQYLRDPEDMSLNPRKYGQTREKKGKKRTRSAAKQLERQEKWQEKLAKKGLTLQDALDFNTVIHRIQHDAHLYLTRPGRDQDTGAVLTECRFPNLGVTELPCAPDTGRFLVPMPSNVHGLPEYIVTRHDNVINADTRRILKVSFKGFMDTKPTAGGNPTREVARSDTKVFPTFHVGGWSKYSKDIFLTGDSKNQDAESTKALHSLIGTLGKLVIPKVEKTLRSLLPSHFETTDSVRKLIQEKYPQIYEAGDGVFDFHGLGNALAFCSGYSDGMHIDLGDSKETVAVILAAGEAVVHFCIPQLDLKIPLYPGQCLTVSARLLSHYAYLFEGTGERLLFNFFTDEGSVAKAKRHAC